MAYERGYWDNKFKFSSSVFSNTYNGILKLMDRMKNNPDPYHWNKFCATHRSWAQAAVLSYIPLYLSAGLTHTVDFALVARGKNLMMTSTSSWINQVARRQPLPGQFIFLPPQPPPTSKPLRSNVVSAIAIPHHCDPAPVVLLFDPLLYHTLFVSIP
jgi:hypothetical protein